MPVTSHREPDKKAAREKYATDLEQKEVADGLAENPSVDPETQRAIVGEYRALHQRIKDDGLYNCPYIEYGKECLRYGFLFGTFIYLLCAKWYFTSAIFLGLFWVSVVESRKTGAF